MPRTVQKISLSGHTLDVSRRAYVTDKFDFYEVENWVKQLSSGRQYEYEAIRDILSYLWSGRYETILDLARENYKKPSKEPIRKRFETEDRFLSTLPLPDRLSGVCHMATGTGKSYVMIAVAILSIVMDKVDRVLIIGPSSTVIERGLTEKFRKYLYGEEGNKLKEFLPDKYKRKVIKLLNSNDPIEDNSITIENLNAIFKPENNSIGDTLNPKGKRVLMLSDEVHHAYMHLKFTGEYNFDPNELENTTSVTDTTRERLWMKYIRENPIKYHIGFTGTPYNQNEFFTDVIFNYSIREATDDNYIKDINYIIGIENEDELTTEERYKLIIDTHFANKKKYSYPDEKGNPRLKPITIFINRTQKNAKDNADIFTVQLAEYYKKYISEYKSLPRPDRESLARKKIIVVTADTNKTEYLEQLKQIEETDVNKIGGEVEFIFAVNKLSEGWDVDNVFQIVPTEERAFNSKLLISQVIGRGLRIPRKKDLIPIKGMDFKSLEKDKYPLQYEKYYPVVSITNHVKFKEQIDELYYQVVESEVRFNSKILDKSFGRSKHNFNLYNLNYVPVIKTVPKDKTDQTNRKLNLEPQTEEVKRKVLYNKGSKTITYLKEFVTLDQIVFDIKRKFKNVTIEHVNFDFGDDFDQNDLPDYEKIKQIIKNAMKEAGIKDDKLTLENKKRIELHFNQFLPKAGKRVLRENIGGDVYGIKTEEAPLTTVNIGRLDDEVTLFISDEYSKELDSENLFILESFEKQDKKHQKEFEETGVQQYSLLKEPTGSDYITDFTQFNNVYVVESSVFKTPQSSVIVSHLPEKNFVIGLIKNSNYIDSWIKSPDSGFYSLDYKYWKGGKDPVHRSFNPDFFVLIDLNKYLSQISNQQVISRLKELQNQGIEKIILATEIKGEDDYKEVTVAKERYGKDHFGLLNIKLSKLNASNLGKDFREDFRQYYIFTLLRTEDMNTWFKHLAEGTIIL